MTRCDGHPGHDAARTGTGSPIAPAPSRAITCRTRLATRRAAGLSARGTCNENAASGSGGRRSAAPRISIAPDFKSGVRLPIANPASSAARNPERLGVRTTTL